VNVKQVWRLLKETFQEWSEDNASRLAASLAYYTVFSLAPLLIIVIAIAGAFFGEEAARGQLEAQLQGLVGPDGASLIQTTIDNANQPGSGSGAIASLISLGVLIFGASGVFAELQDSLNAIWDVKPKPENAVSGFVRKRLLSFAMVLTIGFLLLVSLVISAGLAAVTNLMSSLLPFDFLWQILNFVISFGVITVLFALIYRYLPDVRISWNDVLTGAVITSLLFTIGKSLIGLYLGNSSFSSTYGAAGSLVVILAWVYYSAQILFLGAEFTQVYARRYGTKIVPDDHAVFAEDANRPSAASDMTDPAEGRRGDRRSYRRPSQELRWINQFNRKRKR
jgi:membrane protein